MKIWLIVALLAVATSVAAAAVAAEADSTKTAAKVIEAEETDPPTSTDVAGDDEGSATTESSAATAAEDEDDKKKMKGEKSEAKSGDKQEEGEEEEENEEEEESEEGDSDEDSEEEESKGKERKKAKIESEEEGDHKEEAAGKIKFPTHHQHQSRPVEVPTRSRTFDTPASPVAQQPDLHKTREPKWFFNTPNSKSSDDVPAKVESPKFDFTETSTRAAVHQVWSSARPVAKSVETRPATSRPTDVTPWSDTRKPHHPKWFFNTAKEKSSADGSTKIESPKPTAIFEIPTRKAAAAAAAAPIPTWPSITASKPASANKPVDSSHSDNRRSHSHWYFNTPSKPSDGFAKKESKNTEPAAIEIPTRNGRPAGSHHATHPWTPSSSRPVAPVPVYKPVVEVTPSPPRKQYPRWFFNIKS